MKKIVIYAMTALMSVNTFASNVDSTTVNYAISFDAQTVNHMLGITDQKKADRVNSLCTRFAYDMDNVQKSREKARPNRMVTAVYRNLANMMDLLTREEYHHYLLYVNQVLATNDLAQYFD